MAWNNYNNNNNYNGNRGNYGGQNKGYNNNQRQQRDDVKKSGSTYTTIRKGKREGMIAVTAWRKTKFGLMTAKAFPVSEEVYTSQNGNEYLRYAVEVSNASMGTNTTYWCLMSLKTKKIVINELSLVISPNGSGYTSSGKKVSGFFGANYKRR